MTDPIAQVEAVLADTTPGPWTQRGSLVKATDDTGPFTVVNTTDLDGTEADARFIALARNLMPEALAVVRAAEDHHHGRAYAYGLCHICAALSAFTERVQSALGEEGT